MARSTHEQPYRARALKILPWICAHCGREFEGKKLNHRTVHHKGHDHHNNPPDGSNWELLCLYCHDNEHQRQLQSTEGGCDLAGPDHQVATYAPFAELKRRLARKNSTK